MRKLDETVTDERLAAVAVAFSMTMDRFHPGFHEAFQEEVERLFFIIRDESDEWGAQRFGDALPYLKYLFNSVKRSKIRKRYDTYV